MPDRTDLKAIGTALFLLVLVLGVVLLAALTLGYAVHMYRWAS